MEQIEGWLLNLHGEERRQFANWFYEPEKEIIEFQGTEDPGLT